MSVSRRLNRVVVTGYGGICPLGGNSQDIWNAILAYRLGYTLVSHPNEDVVAKFFGHIPFHVDVSRFSKKLLKYLPRFSRLGLIAADEALSMAFGKDSRRSLDEIYSPHERGVIFGTGWGGEDDIAENGEAYTRQSLASPLSNIMAMPSVGSAAISMNWNLCGYQNTPVAACASGSIAIGDAFEIIRSGRAKMMLAGGGESIRHPFSVWNIDILGALSKEQENERKACCPFSLDRSGFVLSEGAAVLCLEEYENAVTRGAPILAEIIGYSNFSDAWDVTAPDPNLNGRMMVIQTALSQSKVAVQDIDYINAHGTSTPLNDLNETLALKKSFGKSVYNIPISSTKSYTGHLIAASGAMESIFCVKAIEESIAPATLNLLNPDPECDLDFIPNKHRVLPRLETALNVNYGFGGSNSALLFSKAKL
ncbi:beta-ketoacyl-[acyl-carrier-protein] synthase family protein [Brenneria rubrifaciens]|uniref:Beta-ketoacyl-[acyl-carrier-protein] synthase family protein n=1 Tax=Brenneria rubrifaciens TaxID=55213 RepID=A0A4P8QY75_9GAMM|nr:beta-ketoacyl-[acyl-carrier-protein] synthase family protein [Brenneria rubrifaciens]QCR08374.1 beta-ketoacyl-[acyl-carrier-protein] synthase family protein [Brenneria rubrifaciens]